MKPTRRFWLLYTAVWVLFGMIRVGLLTVELGGKWTAAIVGGFSSALVAGILGLAIWALSGRLVLTRAAQPRFYAIHLPFAILFSLAYTGTSYARIAWRVNPQYALDLMRQDAYGWQLFSGLWLYGVMAAVFYVVRAEHRARQQQEAAMIAEASRARAEALHVDAELRALRAQLNPHFLFNALHTVGALVRRDPARAEEAVERLGDLLRYVLDHERGMQEDVTLGQELAFVRDYLMLEQLRVGERLRVIEAIEAEAEACSIPALTLQPLVENAIRYAVAPSTAVTTLRLTASLAGRRLRIVVHDDGRGHDTRSNGGLGMGLQTVRQRLLVRYHGDASMEARNGDGFGVFIDVPAETERA